MNELLIIVSIYSVFITAMYISNKLGPNKTFNQLVEDVKKDLTETVLNIGELVVKAKEIVFDSQFTDAIKEFILIVEEKNLLAKSKGEIYLKGNEKQLEVVRRLTDWVSNLTGSAELGVSFIEDNKSKIDIVINDFIAFSNKMEGKDTLSEAEKIIESKIKDSDVIK